MTAPAWDEATLRFYAAEAPVYASSGSRDPSPHLAAFLDRLEPGASILELGCGGGRDAEAMLAQGFEVEPTDGVPEMARQAAERLARPVAVMRFDELAAEDRYDAVWANASLLHVPLVELSGVLSRIFRALKPGGLHFASFKAGGAEGRDRFGRYFNYPSPAQLREAYRAAGPWRIVAMEAGTGGGYDGRPTPWINLTVHKG